MARIGRPGLFAEQKAEPWDRWKSGQSLSEIGNALGKRAASIFGVVSRSGGIAPAKRQRSPLVLTVAEVACSVRAQSTSCIGLVYVKSRQGHDVLLGAENA